MAKFKVGDRVMMKFSTGRITRIAWNEFGYKSAEPAVVAAVDNGNIYFKYRVLLDNKDPTDCGYWWAAESELSPLLPAIPAGWTPADEPAAKARYVVCAIPTLYDTLEEAELHALRAMESLRVNVVIARVVEEVKPGKPVITKLEE